MGFLDGLLARFKQTRGDSTDTESPRAESAHQEALRPTYEPAATEPPAPRAEPAAPDERREGPV